MPPEDALDEDNRARAAALRLASFIVEAPAGAGKTELLTQRFLRLLATVDAPEDIVAITFTNKAAAEMRERVLGALERASRGEVAKEPHQQQTLELAAAALGASVRGNWDLLGQPGRLRILTIDALCAAIARQMPLLSRFGEQPAITRDPGALYAEAARQTLALLDEEGEGSDALAAPVAAALAWLDNDAERLTRLLVGMLGRREQWLGAVSVEQESDAALALLVDAELRDIAVAVDPRWQALAMPLARFAAANVDAGSPISLLADWDRALPPAVDDLPRWAALAELVLTREGGWRKTVTVRQGFPAGKEHKARKDALLDLLAAGAATPGLGAALARVRELPSGAGREVEDAIVRVFASLLKLAVANLWSVFRARGEVDFSEIAMRSIAALAEPDGIGEAPGPSDLALRLDDRIRHLLVDEFQDTSPAQVALIERLTAGWSAGDGRTLFCVGDPMQSIYRFRKADVALFLKAGVEGIGSVRLERLALCRNNRSLPAVVDWINAAFGQTFPAADRMFTGAVALRPSVATRPDDGSAAAGVFFHALAETGNAAVDDRAEARRVLELIDAARADPANRSIAVLVRARTHLAPLVAEIRRHRPDLRFQAVEVEPLGDRPWIADLLVVTRALLQRADRVHWLALLRSPMVGLTLADLCALAEDDHKSTVWRLMRDADRVGRLSEDGQRRIGHLASILGEAYAAQGRTALARWVEGVWLLLDGPATLPDRAAVEDCEACLALLAELDQTGRFDPDRLETEIGKLYAAPDPQADESLRLMTIHKSKGLEFDTVILPGLHRTVKGNDPQMLLWDEVVVPGEPPRLLVAPVPPRGVGRAAETGGPSAYDYLKDLERRRSRNEDLRVLYVAATRARRTLHLVGTLATGDAAAGGPVDGTTGSSAGNPPAWAPPPANTPMADLWGALASMLSGRVDDASGAAAPVGSSNDPAAFVPPFSRLKDVCRPARLAARPEMRLPQGAAEASARDADDSSALFGTLAHRYLQIIADAADGAGVWDRSRIESAQPAMVWWFEQRGAHAAGALAERLVAVLSGVVGNERGRWVLARRETSAAELALGAAGRISVIDRSFVEDGVRWVIDYKTTPTAGLDSVAIGALAEAHRLQLETYAALFDDGAVPVRVAVFFVDGLHWVELPPRIGQRGQ